MIYFQIFESEAILNNPYNTRQQDAEEKVVRGSIYASDGTTVLAETQVDDEGNETRSYPYGGLFAHTVGYAAKGGSGLESSQNNTLITSHENISEQIQKDLTEQKKQGDSLVTTFDVNLQQKASDVLGDNQGAVIVMEKDTGNVLVDVSKPTFDPNTVEENWDALSSDDSGVLMNRAMQGLYPPGSTFKLVTALAYLRQNGSFDDFSYTCSGTVTRNDFTIHCAGNTAHGKETFTDALANSCNCAFATMAVDDISKSLFRSTAESLGFNSSLDLQLPYTTSQFELDSSTADQLTMQTGIGQGDTLATPMQMCMIAQAIGNGGEMLQPNFLLKVVSADGKEVRSYTSKSSGEVMTEDEASQLEDMMKEVVKRGTAADAMSGLSYDIAGKTGTAEYGSEGKAHSWFAGYSNTGQDDIVVCVLVEGGGNGVAPADEMAAQIFEAYFG